MNLEYIARSEELKDLKNKKIEIQLRGIKSGNKKGVLIKNNEDIYSFICYSDEKMTKNDTLFEPIEVHKNILSRKTYVANNGIIKKDSIYGKDTPHMASWIEIRNDKSILISNNYSMIRFNPLNTKKEYSEYQKILQSSGIKTNSILSN